MVGTITVMDSKGKVSVHSEDLTAMTNSAVQHLCSIFFPFKDCVEEYAISTESNYICIGNVKDTDKVYSVIITY